MRLNLGCGRDIRDGWVNIDCRPAPGVDVVCDFGGKTVLPFGDDTVTLSEGSHVIEHLTDPLPFMEELHRVTVPGGRAVFRCPYGSSDDADEDPTHVRRMFHGSWGFFGQPNYWRADYGYRGDWEPVEVMLLISPDHAGLSDADLQAAVMTRRNVVGEMVAELRAVKPIRAQDKALRDHTTVRLMRPRAAP